MRVPLFALALCGCSLASIDHRRLERHTERHEVTAETWTLGPHTVHAWHGGSGPALLLLHGFGGDGL